MTTKLTTGTDFAVHIKIFMDVLLLLNKWQQDMLWFSYDQER